MTNHKYSERTSVPYSNAQIPLSVPQTRLSSMRSLPGSGTENRYGMRDQCDFPLSGKNAMLMCFLA